MSKLLNPSMPNDCPSTFHGFTCRDDEGHVGSHYDLGPNYEVYWWTEDGEVVAQIAEGELEVVTATRRM